MRTVEKRSRKFIFALLVIMIMSSEGETGCNDVSAKRWTPPWSNKREDLYCYSHCFENEADDNCCTCNSCTTWEGEESYLYIEDLSVTGRNILLSNNQSLSNVYKIHRSYSEMKEFPINLCKDISDTKFGDLITSISNMSEYRSRIVQINLEYNEIEEIGDLSCLYKLDELNLRYNLISFLSNTSFENLSNLRTLNLEGNRLSTMDPNTLSSPNLNILNANLRGNQLSNVDVSNIVLSYPFCEFSFESNPILTFDNENNFILNKGNTYGPGFLNLQNNSMKTFPDLKTVLNIDDLSVLGKVWDFGFDLRGVPITCDCSLQPFLSLSTDVIESLWQDYFDVQCTAPGHLKGISIPDLNLSQLVCRLDADSGCQSPQCTCVDEPNKDTLFIDCSNASPRLQHFPLIPDSNYSAYISLNLSGNEIKYIPDEPYLSKVSILDLSHNDIHEINESIAGRIEDTFLDIRKNDHLLRLPQTFQYRNACNINIDGLIIDCDCDSQWIAQWLKSKACKSSLFYCNVPGKGIIPASSFNVDDLDCSDPNILFKVISITIGSVIILSIVSALILYKFRYEILIMYLRMRRYGKERNLTHPSFMYDVYITLDENNDKIVSWVNNYLHEFLINLGYNVFIPYRDIPFGSVRGDEAVHAIKRSSTFLVILSNNHFHMNDDERTLTDYEWKYGWNNFRTDRCKKIVLVNFDHVSAGDIKHPQVKAFLSVGYCINFKNHNRDIMEQIRVHLGEPQVSEHQGKLNGPPLNLFVTEKAGKKIMPNFNKEYSNASVSLIELEL